MYTLRIEHRTANYSAWKQAFDSDPAGRERSGVRRYRVMRSLEDPNYVLIDLDFDTPSQAEALLGAMRGIWVGPASSLISDPQARIVAAVDAQSC